MADQDKFDEFYRVTLRPRLQELEGRRRRLVLLAVGLVALVAPAGLIFGFAPNGASVWSTAVPWLLGAAIPVAIGFFFKFGSFSCDYKEAIIESVIRFIDPGFCYRIGGFITQPEVEAGRIFTREINRFSGEDGVKGMIGQTTFKFSEVHAEHRIEGKKGKDTWLTVFRGIYLVADFNKNFRFRTVVLPDTAERAFGFLGQTLQSVNPDRASLIKLEDPEFEREFVVYGEDQVEARYILSPSLMQRMLALKRKVDGKVHFAFAGSQVHVAIATRKDYFEPSLFFSALDPGAAAQYYRDVLQFVGIVEDLNLNTRIWTKN